MLVSRFAFFAQCAFLLAPGLGLAGPVVQPEDRIVFIGDSITGQGGRGEGGWMALIGKGLKQSNPANQQTLVPLGGSGHKVASWGNIEKKSRTQPVLLDIKEFDVQKELSQHADIVVIMLGMNDVLSAQLPNSPAGTQGWKEDYRSLLKAVRERTTPRVLALATPTPCTEDPSSPKNQVMENMVAVLRELAQEENCRILPTRDSAWDVLGAGRAQAPGFHITTDQVHPNPAGHAAIAAGMLRGLEEAQAAELLRGEALSRAKRSGLSVEWRLQPTEQVGWPMRLKLTAYHGGEPVGLSLPEGWTAAEPEKRKGASIYAIEARPEFLKNVVTLRSSGKTLESVVPAPWLVATANAGWQGWKSGVFDVKAGEWPVDELVRTGTNFAEVSKAMELKPGTPLVWKTYLGSIDYGGGGAPGVIDFAQVTYFSGGEIGYGLRWVESEKDRPVRVKISRPGFAGVTYAQVWVNGETVFTGDPSKAKDAELKTSLRKGWNLVSFKGNFQQWQWQLGIDLEPESGDSLEGLRYSIEPH